MALRRMRIAFWMPKATDTHSEYITLIARSTGIMIAQMRVNVTFIRMEKIFEREKRVFIFSTILSEIFHFLRKTKRHVIRHV
jgi:hypothetical protein